MGLGIWRPLKQYVVDAHTVQKRIEDCALAFSDQIPWWGIICRKKQMYLRMRSKAVV